MLRYPTNSILNEAVTELKLIYIVYFLGTLLVSIIYYIQIFDQSVGLIGFLATISASSITFLLANNFQQFYIGQGRIVYSCSLYSGTKNFGIISLVALFHIVCPFLRERILDLLYTGHFSLYGVKIFLKSGNSISRAISIVKAYSHQWITFFLHGIYGPLLMLSVYDLEKSLVPTLGLAILIAQPARMIYQFSIQAKIRLIKDQISDDFKSINIRSIYSDLVVRSVFLIFSMQLQL